MSSSPVALPLARRVLRSLAVGNPPVARASAGLPPRGWRGPWPLPGRRAVDVFRAAARAQLAEPSMALWVRRRKEPPPSAAHAWRVLALEAELALVAWSCAPRADRRRAHRAYRDALAREAWAAALLAQFANPAAGAAG